MKKVLLVALSVLMVFALFGCSQPQTAEESPAATQNDTQESANAGDEASTAAGAGKKVAGVVFQEDQFMKLLQLGYQEAAEAAGYEFYPGNTNSDAAKEVELLNTYITQGYAGLAISPISEEASLEPLSNAADQGLQIALSNSNLGSQDWMIACYTSDNYQLGQFSGEACREYIENNLDGKAKIGILQYKSLLPEQSAQRSQGFIDALEGMEGVEIVADQDAWMQDKAITVAGDMLTSNPDIDILWGANEGGTVGAAMAIKNAGLAGKVVAFGTDASEQTIALLQADDNILQAVTGQDPYQIGLKTMQVYPIAFPPGRMSGLLSGRRCWNWKPRASVLFRSMKPRSGKSCRSAAPTGTATTWILRSKHSVSVMQR